MAASTGRSEADVKKAEAAKQVGSLAASGIDALMSLLQNTSINTPRKLECTDV
jgi:hypothetical protein